MSWCFYVQEDIVSYKHSYVHVPVGENINEVQNNACSLYQEQIFCIFTI